MIERYTLPEMGKIWSDQSKYEKWLEVELLAVEAWSELGEVPREVVEPIRRKAAFTPERILEIEAVTHHDVIAFLTNVAENVGEDSRYIHYGLTSSDVLDTGLALQMRDAIDLILDEARSLTLTLKARALEFRSTPMIGRTHGIHAEPTVFGHKLALYAFEMARDLERLRRAREVISCGKLSGAVGVYGNIDPRVEAYVCDRLGLKPGRGVHPGAAARPPRRVPGGPRHHRGHLREDRHRGARPAAHRHPGGGGALRQGAEGVLGHAPQAQPHHLRARRRHGQAAAGQRPGRPGERHPLARAGHLPLLGGAGDHPRLHHRPPLHAGKVT